MQTYGNRIQTQQDYFPSGRLKAISAGAGSAVQNLAYQYDPAGNIASRSDENQHLQETFQYDALNRLRVVQMNSAGAGTVTLNYDYDALGNITRRSDLGTYSYGASAASRQRPHAVRRVDLDAGGYRSYRYDANGNLAGEAQYDAHNNPVADKGRLEAYTSFNMPLAFGSPGSSAAYQYGPEHQRVMELSSSQGATIFLNPGNSGELLFEKQIKADNTVELRSYLTAYGMVVGVVKQVIGADATTSQVQYYHRDHLGSTTAVSDERGAVIEWLAYEPFGKRRFPSGVADPNTTIAGVSTERGYTNHQHIDELGLIHMNGRIYDPVVGRFMSADPKIQSPDDLQSYNRYSYVLNNPLGYTDPSGYLSLFGIKILPGVFNNKNAGIAAAIGITLFAPQFLAEFPSWGLAGISSDGMVYLTFSGGAVVGGTAGLIGSGGNTNAALAGALTGGFGAFGAEVAGHSGGVFGKVLGSGISAKAVGGDFASGIKYGLMGAIRSEAFNYMKTETDRLATEAWGSNVHTDANGNIWTYGGRKCASGENGQCPSFLSWFTMKPEYSS